MCGRVAVARPLDALARLFAARLAPGLVASWAPSWNVAPTDPLVGLVAAAGGQRVLHAYRWGLVPASAASLAAGSRLFNARAETVAVSPAFRAAARSRRLALPVDGFFEWHGEGKRRHPLFFSRADGAPLVLAGLWERWHDVLTCTIVTTAAGPDLQDIHDRMPVVLEPDHLERWLDHSPLSQSELHGLVRPSPGGTLTSHPVDRRVGDVRNNAPELVEPVPPDDAPPEPEALRLFG